MCYRTPSAVRCGWNCHSRYTDPARVAPGPQGPATQERGVEHPQMRSGFRWQRAPFASEDAHSAVVVFLSPRGLARSASTALADTAVRLQPQMLRWPRGILPSGHRPHSRTFRCATGCFATPPGCLAKARCTSESQSRQRICATGPFRIFSSVRTLGVRRLLGLVRPGHTPGSLPALSRGRGLRRWRGRHHEEILAHLFDKVLDGELARPDVVGRFG
jgi:hypothetical protein